MTVGHACAIALDLAKTEMAASSQHTYAWLARQTLEYWGESRELESIDRLQVQAWANVLRGRMAASSLRTQLSWLNKLYTIAFSQGHLYVSPVSKLRLPRINNRRERVLLPEEEAPLMQQLGPSRWSLILFAIHTGMRRKEQFSLQSGDVTLWEEGGQLRGMAWIQTSKTGKGRRCPLNPVAAKIAKEWQKRGLRYLFGGQGPDRLSVGQYYSSLLQEACDRAGIQGLRWHDLRHTCASRAIRKGAKLEQVQALLGHSSVTQTERYTHWSEDHLWPAAMALVRA